MNELAKVINQLKELSNEEIINVPLPDDNLLVQLNIENSSKKSVIFSNDTWKDLSVWVEQVWIDEN